MTILWLIVRRRPLFRVNGRSTNNYIGQQTQTGTVLSKLGCMSVLVITPLVLRASTRLHCPDKSFSFHWFSMTQAENISVFFSIINHNLLMVHLAISLHFFEPQWLDCFLLKYSNYLLLDREFTLRKSN